jgi:hypothetical protein
MKIIVKNLWTITLSYHISIFRLKSNHQKNNRSLNRITIVALLATFFVCLAGPSKSALLYRIINQFFPVSAIIEICLI